MNCSIYTGLNRNMVLPCWIDATSLAVCDIVGYHSVTSRLDYDSALSEFPPSHALLRHGM